MESHKAVLPNQLQIYYLVRVLRVIIKVFSQQLAKLPMIISIGILTTLMKYPGMSRIMTKIREMSNIMMK
jgi:hypothetical protein